MPRPKKDVVFAAFRLSRPARTLLDELADRMGLTLTGVVETALRVLARREGLAVPNSESEPASSTINSSPGA